MQTSFVAVHEGFYSNNTKFTTENERKFFEKQYHYQAAGDRADTIFSSLSTIQMAPEIRYEDASDKFIVQIPRYVPSFQLLNDLPSVKKIKVSYYLHKDLCSFCFKFR